MACRPARRLAALCLSLLAGPGAALAQASIPASAADGLRVHVTLHSFEMLGERCGSETGDVAAYADAAFEWLARNDQARHIADAVLAYHGVVPVPAEIAAAAEADFAAAFAGSTTTLGEFCGYFLGGVYEGRFDFTEYDAALWERLLAADAAISAARRAQ